MDNRRASSPTPKGTNGICEVVAMAAMWAAMDELRRHNWMLEDDV